MLKTKKRGASKVRSVFVTPAIVLRSRPFGESDKIVSFLTQDYGKITGIAKGAKRSRKRFVNTLEPFCLVNLQFQDRHHSSLAFIQSCDWIQPFKHLKSNLGKITHASYLVEITDELTQERDENRLLFEHLRQGLDFIEENETSQSFLTIFEMKLLKLAGYQPMLESCRRCGKGRSETNGRLPPSKIETWRPIPNPGWHFSPRDGGLLCGSCLAYRKEAFPLSLEALTALVRLQEEESMSPSALNISLAALKETRSFLLRFIQFQINKELKSAPFLDTFCVV